MTSLSKMNPFTQPSQGDDRATRAADGLVALESLIKENEAIKTELSRKSSEVSRLADEKHLLAQHLDECRTSRDHYMQENAKLVATIDSLSAIVAKAHAEAHDTPELTRAPTAERIAHELSEIKGNGQAKQQVAKK